MILLQHGRKFDMEVGWVVISIELDDLSDKLLGELRDVRSEPSVQGECLNVITGSEHNNELVWLDRTVGKADRDKNFACLFLNDGKESLHVLHEISKAGHGHIQNKDFVVGG